MVINHFKENLMCAVRFSSLLLYILYSFRLIDSFLLAFHCFHCSSSLCHCLFPGFYFVMFISLSFLSYSLSLLLHVSFTSIFTFSSILSFLAPYFSLHSQVLQAANPLRPDPVKSVVRTSVRKQATHTHGFAWVYSAALDE